jgi:hypothetical protein
MHQYGMSVAQWTLFVMRGALLAAQRRRDTVTAVVYAITQAARIRRASGVSGVSTHRHATALSWRPLYRRLIRQGNDPLRYNTACCCGRAHAYIAPHRRVQPPCYLDALGDTP